MNQQPLTIQLHRDVLEPGESLTGRYWLDKPTAKAAAAKLRVYWRSEGKGDEDRAVQCEETRTIEAGEVTDASSGEFSVILPPSPLSYDGILIKIIWLVQVSVFADDLEAEVPFQVGHVAKATEVEK